MRRMQGACYLCPQAACPAPIRLSLRGTGWLPLPSSEHLAWVLPFTRAFVQTYPGRTTSASDPGISTHRQLWTRLKVALYPVGGAPGAAIRDQGCGGSTSAV
jgi:hypothetical protein